MDFGFMKRGYGVESICGIRCDWLMKFVMLWFSFIVRYSGLFERGVLRMMFWNGVKTTLLLKFIIILLLNY